jgi:hypothetical protein
MAASAWTGPEARNGAGGLSDLDLNAGFGEGAALQLRRVDY